MITKHPILADHKYIENLKLIFLKAVYFIGDWKSRLKNSGSYKT